jgi:hypothetical protein
MNYKECNCLVPYKRTTLARVARDHTDVITVLSFRHDRYVSCCNQSVKNSYGFVCIDSPMTFTVDFSFIVTTYIERLKKIVNASIRPNA